MGGTNHLCAVCVQVIANPICPSCFLKEIKMWLRDKEISYHKRIILWRSLNRLTNEMEDSPSEINCIFCDSMKVTCCVYCLAAGIGEVIEKNVPNRIINDFNKDFNIRVFH